MARLLKDVNDVNALLEAIQKCDGDVWLRSTDGREEFNMKSVLSRYMGIGKLLEEQGDLWEFFCGKFSDEAYLFKFFNEIKKGE